MGNEIIWPLGHDLIFNRLLELYRSNKMPPVMLLWGKKGIGKSMLLKRIAAMIYCDSQNACGTCASCHMAVNGQHNDVLILNEEVSILKVDDSKSVSDHLAYMALSARIVIISDVDRMNEHAVNKLLKTFEETPRQAFVIMSSSRIDSLLPTLKSRSVKIQVSPPQSNELFLWARQKVSDISDQELEYQCAMAGNSPGVLLDLLKREGTEQLITILEEQHIQDKVQKLERYIKESGIDAATMVDEMEFALNKIYRREFKPGCSISGIRERRVALKNVRDMAVKRKVSLNTLSAAEGIALATLI